tara:strand:+ start:225 stop:1121 length:897 start_codon:yes stop_codon:yes gene_type:complete
MLMAVAHKQESDMLSKFNIHPDADFDVGLRNIYNVKQEVITGKKEVYRKDTDDGLAVVSSTYKPRSYKKAIDHFTNLILNSNIDTSDVEIRDTVDNNGAVYLRNWRFNRIKGIQMFDDPLERSIFELQFRSSHNQRFAEDLIAWSRYLWCDNGCANEDWTLHVRIKHNTDKDIEIGYQAIDDAIGSFFQGEEEKKQWIEKEIAFYTVKQLFQQTLAFTPQDTHTKSWYSDIQMDVLMKLYAKYSTRYGQNMFAVFQTATDWSTHVTTKGKTYNVQERRGSRIKDMKNHEIWLDHVSYK